MKISLTSSGWRRLWPALAFSLALALVQIGSGLLAYYESKNLLWEGKYQTARHLAQGLVVAVADQVVLRDYASVEARMLQTMANIHVASVLFADTSGKVITHLQRTPGQAPHLVFEPGKVILPRNLEEELVQSHNDALITTWAKIRLGLDVGWVRIQTYNALDSEDLVQLQQRTLLLSVLSVLSGAFILGLFLWRGYFAVIKREHFIAMQLDETSNRLLQSEKLASLGQMAAGVAHEINNPLGYVSSNVSTLQKYLSVYDKLLDQADALQGDAGAEMAVLKKQLNYQAIRGDIQHLFSETREGLSRVKSIVHDLKDFSRSNATMEFVRADILQGLQSTLNIVHSEVKSRAEIQLELNDLPQVECVPSQINQIFLNLIVNAAHAIPPDRQGVIRIRSGRGRQHVWVDVQDNGNGIPKEIQGKIFDPFFTTKGAGQGTGLGLAVSQGIAQRHGGSLHFVSTVGEGTTFRLTLPLRQPSQPAR